MKKVKLKNIGLGTRLLYFIIGFFYKHIMFYEDINENVLPAKIGQYILFKDLKKEKKKPYMIGIYYNKSGKYVIAKMWKGKIKDMNYFSLYNEIIVYKTLSKVIKRVRKSKPLYLRKVTLPEYLGSIEDKGMLVLFIEYIDGVSIDKNSNSQELSRLYAQCIKFLAYLSNHFTLQERYLIPKRLGVDYLILYPFILIVSVIKQPRLIMLLIRGSLIVVRSIPVLLRNKKIGFVHGDLHPGNIFIKGDSIKIIDLEQAVFTYLEYEFISTILCLSTSKIFVERILKDIKKSALCDKSFALFFSTLTINRVTHYLTGEISREKLDLFVKILREAIDIYKQSSISPKKD